MKEMLVEVFLRVLRKDPSNSRCIELWTSGSAQHLQHVRKIHIFVTLDLCIEELCAFYNHEMRWQINAPCQGTGGDKDLNLVVGEKFLCKLTIRFD